MAGKDRERRLARERYERQQARRSEARRRARRRNAWISAALATAVVVGGLGYLTAVSGSDEGQRQAAATPSPSAEPTPTESPSPTTPPGACEYRDAAGGKVKDVGRPPAEPAGKAPYDVTLATDRGEVTFTAATADAPCTVNSLRFLAGKSYFDGSRCHRLTTQGIYVLQCGDPTATGQGGPGYEFDEENLPEPGGATYPKGTVAMANAGPGTNGSQFFIVYKDTTLPPDYTIFGEVTRGLGVVEKVAAAGTETGGGDGPPKQSVVIRDVRVTEQKT